MLRFDQGRLGIAEYIDYGLHDMPGLSRQEKAKFVGWRCQRILEEMLVDDYSRFFSQDKLTFYRLAAAAGFPIPRLHAIYAPVPRGGALRRLADSADLEHFLRTWRDFPLYGKPCFGGFGRRNFVIRGIANECVELAGRQPEPLTDFAEDLPDPAGLGFMFMEVLRPHGQVLQMAGSSISGLRVHVLRLRSGPCVYRPVWKIARDGAVVDNFWHGTTGNLLASIDTESGRVARVVGSSGGALVEVDEHPDTGRRLAGFQLPHWQRLCETVREASHLFPGFLCQAWDVAICEEGPILMEVNCFGDCDLSQYAYGRGFLDGELLELLQERDLLALLQGPGPGKKGTNPNGRMGARKAHWPY